MLLCHSIRRVYQASIEWKLEHWVRDKHWVWDKHWVSEEITVYRAVISEKITVGLSRANLSVLSDSYSYRDCLMLIRNTMFPTAERPLIETIHAKSAKPTIIVVNFMRHITHAIETKSIKYQPNTVDRVYSQLKYHQLHHIHTLSFHSFSITYANIH